MILETKRLLLRELEESDFAALCRTLQDKDAMYAYEHAFSDEEVHQWLARQMRRYREDGFGLWAVILKETGDFIGQCGLTKQPVDNTQVTEIGYLLQRDHWHNGYATEAALACKDYAFSVLGEQEVYSIIRPENTASIRVAERLGMTYRKTIVKHYYGMDMPHAVYMAPLCDAE